MIKHSLPRVEALPTGATRKLGVPSPAPTPEPDFLFTGYPGTIGAVEAALVLAITGSAAWAGIRTGLGDGSKALKYAGWVGGVGSCILGLLYLGGKSGYNQLLSLPAVRVTPS